MCVSCFSYSIQVANIRNFLKYANCASTTSLAYEVYLLEQLKYIFYKGRSSTGKKACWDITLKTFDN